MAQGAEKKRTSRSEKRGRSLLGPHASLLDRSQLIERSIHTLRHTLIEEMIVVGLVCILFLLHARSELVAIFVAADPGAGVALEEPLAIRFGHVGVIRGGR